MNKKPRSIHLAISAFAIGATAIDQHGKHIDTSNYDWKTGHGDIDGKDIRSPFYGTGKPGTKDEGMFCIGTTDKPGTCTRMTKSDAKALAIAMNMDSGIF